MAFKIDAKCEGKLSCAFKYDMRNLANFHRLKSNNCKSLNKRKMAELNQNKNSK